jgi:hypothetical protein
MAMVVRRGESYSWKYAMGFAMGKSLLLRESYRALCRRIPPPNGVYSTAVVVGVAERG